MNADIAYEQFAFEQPAAWIWCAEAKRAQNNFVCFRRDVQLWGAPQEAALAITADSRYEVFVNGEWVGHGPARSWLSPWPVDEYDLRGVLRPGRNVIAVLVQHYGISTFQYLHADPGLLAQLKWRDTKGAHCVVTDGSWKCAPNLAHGWPVQRISCQQAWEEQFDARKEPAGWREVGFNDKGWKAAKVVRKAGQPPHEKLERRGIPMLTREPVEPASVMAVEAVRPANYVWSLNPRPALNASDLSANHLLGNMLFATCIHSDAAQAIQFHMPHGPRPLKLNGQPVKFDDATKQVTDSGVAHAHLKAGWNLLLCRMPQMIHQWSQTMSLWTEKPVKFSAKPDGGGVPWLVLGPFGGVPPLDKRPFQRRYIEAEKVDSAATGERFEAIWKKGELSADDLAAPFAKPAAPDMIAQADIFALGASERVVSDVKPHVDEPSALQRDNGDWTTIHPVAGADTRLLLDFGREVIGYHEFEVDAPAGTVLDFHNFEFIQRDGRMNLAEGMANSFRYVCRDGVQGYRTFTRRGFRYSWMSVRNATALVRIRFVRVLMSTYPVAQAGDFACSDDRLTAIWRVGAHSVRCCAEDSYTDCPSYEQTLWVGDARNEALVDLVANGDPRLSRRCWFVTGRSLDRSPITESHVPSGWENVLPAWTFLWMRWAEEHYQLAGDKATARAMMPFLEKNAQGIEKHVNAQGLFEMAGWNMFDWAPMDTPPKGVVTHLNCLAVLGLRQTANLAKLIGENDAGARWTKLADKLAAAVNGQLWSEEKRAYLDCIRADGTRSPVFSQQTQTAAYIAGVAQGERAKRCWEIMERAPEGFVQAGSPFFMFFMLEGYVREGKPAELINTIRDYWGKQIAAGATTFWEMYHEKAKRLTRSHCHGWSAAPTFFLTQQVLGVQPAEPGYATVRIAPQPGELAWAHGRVPTPRGVVECAWNRDADGFKLRLVLPPGTPGIVELPVSGDLIVEQGEVKEKTVKEGRLHLRTESQRLLLRVKQ